MYALAPPGSIGSLLVCKHQVSNIDTPGDDKQPVSLHIQIVHEIFCSYPKSNAVTLVSTNFNGDSSLIHLIQLS